MESHLADTSGTTDQSRKDFRPGQSGSSEVPARIGQSRLRRFVFGAWSLFALLVVTFLLRISSYVAWMDALSKELLVASTVIAAGAAVISSGFDAGWLRPSNGRPVAQQSHGHRRRVVATVVTPVVTVTGMIVALALVHPAGNKRGTTKEPSPSAPPADATSCITDLDADRYANSGKQLSVGLHVVAHGVDRWSQNVQIWIFIYQTGVGFFPTPDPAQRGGGAWRSERIQFGTDDSGPDNAHRDLIVATVNASAVEAIQAHRRTAANQPMAAMPSGSHPEIELTTVRTC